MLLDKNYLKKITLSLDALILTSINNLNSSGLKIVLVIDKNEKFIGIVNDGDIRRAFSGGYKINDPIRKIVNKKTMVIEAISDLNSFSFKEINLLTHIPIIKNNKIHGLYINNVNSNIITTKKKEHVVIMAGGYGKRLGVLTKSCPKALLKFNNKSLLQHILDYLEKNNFYNIQISVFFLKEMIKNFILKKSNLSLKIKYLEERQPMGTIGSIGLIKKISNNFIVLNCDVITDVNLGEMLKFHKKNKFISFKEKPEIDFTINAGIYIFNKKIISLINKFNLKNIEDLIITLNNKNYKILTYLIFENWYDLGQDKKRLKKYN